MKGTRDRQSVTADWDVLRDLIDGVTLKEVRHVTKGNGWVTELWRSDWGLDDLGIDQAFQVTLLPGKLTAWHVHYETTDRLFVNRGLLKVVLYDGREDSPSHGRINEFHLGEQRPALVVVPPGVWHGIQNASAVTGSVVNLVDRAYEYEHPDHWRVPADCSEIPYRF